MFIASVRPSVRPFVALLRDTCDLLDFITILHIFEMKSTGTSEKLAQLHLKRCRDEDLDELDDKAMKHIANLQKSRSIVLMVSLSSPLFLKGANFFGTGLVLRVFRFSNVVLLKRTTFENLFKTSKRFLKGSRSPEVFRRFLVDIFRIFLMLTRTHLPFGVLNGANLWDHPC